MIADLRTLETHHAHRQFRTLNEEIEAAGEEIERLRKAQAGQEEEIEAQETHVMARRAQIEELEAELTGARQAVQDLKSHIQNAEHRIGFNAERVEEFGGLIERYGRDIAAAEERLAVQQSQIEHNDQELAEITEALKSEQAAADGADGESECAVRGAARDGERALQSVFSSIARIENRLSALRNEVGSPDKPAGRERDAAGDFAKRDRATGQRRGAGAGAARKRAGADRGAIAPAGGPQPGGAGGGRTKRARSGRNWTGRTGSCARRNGLLAEKESRAGALRQMIESGEGLGEGTQAVLRGLDNAEFYKPAIGGVLASHIRVGTEDVAAVEAAFGQNLQSIVMKDAMVAEAMVKTLSDKAMGPGAIDPARMAGRGGRRAGHDEAAPQGTLGWARERVKTEPALAPLVALLLGRFAHCAGPGDGVAAGREQLQAPAEKRCDFVTVPGEVVTRQGILTGGRARGENAGASVLHRKNQVAAARGAGGGNPGENRRADGSARGGGGAAGRGAQPARLKPARKRRS